MFNWKSLKIIQTEYVKPWDQDASICQFLVAYKLHLKTLNKWQVQQATSSCTFSGLEERTAKFDDLKTLKEENAKQALIYYLTDHHKYSCFTKSKQPIWSVFPHLRTIWRNYKEDKQMKQECDFYLNGRYYYEFDAVEDLNEN